MELVAHVPEGPVARTGGVLRGEPGVSFSADQPLLQFEPFSNPLALLLLWGDFGRLRWDRVLSGEAVGSAYYLKTGLVRKADLHFYLSKHAARDPAATVMDSVPTT